MPDPAGAQVSLRQYIEKQLEMHEKSHADAQRTGLFIWEGHRREHEAEHEADKEAERALGVRLSGLNEFRGQLRDQQSTFITREVYDERHEALAQRVEALEKSHAADRGTREQSERATRLLIGLAGLFLAGLVIVVNLVVKVL